MDSIDANNSLNVLLVRIRRKCREKCSLDFPVNTVRKKGFIFEEVLTLI